VTSTMVTKIVGNDGLVHLTDYSFHTTRRLDDFAFFFCCDGPPQPAELYRVSSSVISAAILEAEGCCVNCLTCKFDAENKEDL
jgi:hypothetical protein